LALADKMRSRSQVTCCIFGDGAVAEGEFHESMNLAALWKLPVLFVCENNRYAMGTRLDVSHSQTDLAKKAASYAVTAAAVDGMDILAVEEAAKTAAEYVRSGKGPYFLECLTYRFRAHSMYDPELYRDKAEVEEWKKRDPIPALIARLQGDGSSTGAKVQQMESGIAKEIEESIAFAEAGTLEPVEDLLRFVYSEKRA
jgi:pyruvate dehydrogenase E1 component alpha subunit